MPDYKRMYKRLSEEINQTYLDLQFIGEILLRLQQAKSDAEELYISEEPIQLDVALPKKAPLK